MVKRPVVVARGDSSGVPSKVAAAIDAELILARGDNLVPALQTAYKNGRPIVAMIAVPIVIRTLAPLLGSKYEDPSVVVCHYQAKFVMPLLGTSHGGTRLARQVAERLGAELVSFGVTNQLFRAGNALDDAPEGYFLANPADYKDFAVRILDGEPVAIEGNAPWLSELPQSSDAQLKISITHQDIKGSPQHLVFIESVLAVGLGCERGVSSEEVEKLVDRVVSDNNIHRMAVAAYATIDVKEDEAALRALFEYDSRFRLFSAEELREQLPKVKNPSAAVEAEVGVASVSEAAALATIGPGAELLVAKTKSSRVTCAIARSRNPILAPLGRPPGVLYVVGVGPGHHDLRSPDAGHALWRSTDWVGYGLYLDLVADAKSDQHTEHRFPLGAEEDRVRQAINLAKEGKRVALICSGDAGIYAMAALVYEIIDLEPARIEVTVIPGISAFQAAAAKAGAMIGHDFCCISLSDLLTPWEVIERRVKAAAEGDFVISFYNPRSLKRRNQLERAFAILAPHRSRETPVVIASNLGRPEEKVKIVRFADFNPDEIDMLTLVMVGSSQSKSFVRGDGRTYAYTPRGYAKKRVAAE